VPSGQVQLDLDGAVDPVLGDADLLLARELEHREEEADGLAAAAAGEEPARSPLRELQQAPAAARDKPRGGAARAQLA
jgi:hypothetical protein